MFCLKFRLISRYLEYYAISGILDIHMQNKLIQEAGYYDLPWISMPSA